MRIAAAAELESLEQPNEADQLLARGPQSAAILTARASILNRAGDRQALAELYRQAKTIAAETPSPELGLLLGQLAEALEQREDALAWYAEVPPDGPGATQAVLRSVFVLAEVGRLEEGLARLHGIQGSESTDRDSLRDAFLFEGELLLDAERPDAALDAYTRGLERLPADPELRYARALAHERRDDIASAEAELRAMLADDPENINALNALGYTLADRTERFDEAMELIERALTMAPENAAVIDSMGWVLFRKGRVEEALPYLRRAFELLPDAEVAAHLGEALWVGERLDEARSVWREGLRVDPEHRVLIGTLRRLAPDLLP
ncbi:MAG TPA: hypothetical protein DDZ76_03000 [Xanthomonadales bacterium]|nr:hypothetical protein [Xanthomonadales bacterium]